MEHDSVSEPPVQNRNKPPPPVVWHGLVFSRKLKGNHFQWKVWLEKLQGLEHSNNSKLRVCNMMIQINYATLFQTWKYSEEKKAFITTRIFFLNLHISSLRIQRVSEDNSLSAFLVPLCPFILLAAFSYLFSTISFSFSPLIWFVPPQFGVQNMLLLFLLEYPLFPCLRFFL